MELTSKAVEFIFKAKFAPTSFDDGGWVLACAIWACVARERICALRGLRAPPGGPLIRRENKLSHLPFILHYIWTSSLILSNFIQTNRRKLNLESNRE